MASGRPLVCSVLFMILLVFAQHLIVPIHFEVLDNCFSRFPSASAETLIAADDVQALGFGKLIKGCGRHIGSFIFKQPHCTRQDKNPILRQWLFHGINYRIQGHFGPPHLHVSESLVERRI